MKSADTSAWKCLAFFALCYPGMMVVATLIISMFEFDLHSINTAIFAGAAFVTGEYFVRKNNRLWTAREKWILIFGILLVTLVIDGVASLSSLPSEGRSGLTFALGIVGSLYFF